MKILNVLILMSSLSYVVTGSEAQTSVERSADMLIQDSAGLGSVTKWERAGERKKNQAKSEFTYTDSRDPRHILRIWVESAKDGKVLGVDWARQYGDAHYSFTTYAPAAWFEEKITPLVNKAEQVVGPIASVSVVESVDQYQEVLSGSEQAPRQAVMKELKAGFCVILAQVRKDVKYIEIAKTAKAGESVEALPYTIIFDKDGNWTIPD
jgi:hypothetical protein